MKAYYVDLARGPNLTFIAGPFADEATARRYEIAAFKKAIEIDPRRQFDSFGVTSTTDFFEPGFLNDSLKIPSHDLLSHRAN